MDADAQHSHPHPPVDNSATYPHFPQAGSGSLAEKTAQPAPVGAFPLVRPQVAGLGKRVCQVVERLSTGYPQAIRAGISSAA